jgi:hypothetical protein
MKRLIQKKLTLTNQEMTKMINTYLSVRNIYKMAVLEKVLKIILKDTDTMKVINRKYGTESTILLNEILEDIESEKKSIEYASEH